MNCSNDPTRALFLKQKTILEARILNFNLVFDQALANPNRSYSLNTGQSTQSVSRDNMKDYQELYESLLNQYATICARLGFGGTVTVFSGW